MSWISPTAFSSIRGVTKQAVLKAIKTGRLRNSVRKNADDKWEVNPEAAQLEWNANTDKNKQNNIKKSELPPPRQDSFFYTKESEIPAADISISRQQREEYAALNEKLKYESASGRLIETAVVKTEWMNIVTSVKTKLLGLPSKAKASLPHLTTQDVSVIDRLVREALEDLSHGTH